MRKVFRFLDWFLVQKWPLDLSMILENISNIAPINHRFFLQISLTRMHVLDTRHFDDISIFFDMSPM